MAEKKKNLVEALSGVAKKITDTVSDVAKKAAQQAQQTVSQYKETNELPTLKLSEENRTIKAPEIKRANINPRFEIKGVTGQTVNNWAKPAKTEPRGVPYRQTQAQQTPQWVANEIKIAEDKKRSFDTKIKSLEAKYPEYKNLTKYGVQSPSEYLASGKDEHKYADYAFDIVSKKHDDYFDSIDTSNAETVSGDMYAKEYGDAYNEALKMRNRAMYDRAETFDRNRQQAVNMWGLPDVTKADGFYNRGTQHVAPSVAKTSLENYSKGGNVDLTDRTVFDGSNIKQFGWDVKDGEAVTTLTNTYTNKDGSVAMNFTPIGKKADGSYFVLTPDELTQYAEAVAEGTREDDLGLKIGKTFEGANAVKKATEEADRIHTLQEDYYLNGQINQQINRLESIVGKSYPWKQDKGTYDFTKYITEEQKEKDVASSKKASAQSRSIATLVKQQGGSSEVSDYFNNLADYYDGLDEKLDNYMVQQRSIASNEKDFNSYIQKIKDDEAFFSDIKAIANGGSDNRFGTYALTEEEWKANGGKGSYLQYVWEQMSELATKLNKYESENYFDDYIPMEEIEAREKDGQDMSYYRQYHKLLDTKKDLAEDMLKVAYAIDLQKDGLTKESNAELQKKIRLVNDTWTGSSVVQIAEDVIYSPSPDHIRALDEAKAVASIAEAFKFDEKYDSKNYDKSALGKFGANFSGSWIGMHANDMWNRYKETGNDNVKKAALMLDKTAADFNERNKKAMEYDDWAPDLITKNLASQLPQTLKQMETALPYAIIGGTFGSSMGLGEAIKGAQTGYVLGTSIEGFNQMSGDAMRTLTTEYNLPYQEAVKIANNEGLLNAFVEGSDTALSLITWGFGKIPGAKDVVANETIKGTISSMTKNAATKLGLGKGTQKLIGISAKTLIDASGEGAEEFVQSAISASSKRIAKSYFEGEDIKGLCQLVGESFSFNNYTDEDWEQIKLEGWEGFKTGLVMAPMHGATSFATNTVVGGYLEYKNDLEIGTDILRSGSYNRVIINALMSGDKAIVKSAEKLMGEVDAMAEDESIGNAIAGKMGSLYRKTAESLIDNTEYTSPVVPTSSSYTENKGLNDVLNGLNIKAVDEIVSDTNLMNEFAKVSGVNLYSPVNNPKVNGAVKTVANGGDLNSKAINDILNDSNAMNELEEASGVALTRTSDTSIRQSIRDAVGVLAEESPRMAVAQYATTKALARGAVALQSIGYTKTDAENIMSRYAGEQNPEEVAKLMKAVSMLERDIYTNPEYGLGRFASAEKSAEVLGTAVKLMTNPEAVITRQTLEGFAKAFTDSAKQTNSIGYKNIVSALKEYGFEGNDAEVRQLLYNAVYEGKAEYRGKDFSDNRFVSAFADNLKLFTNSTLAFASSNNPNLTPANMQTVIAINKNNWSDVLQITEDSGIIDSKGSGNNGRKILRQAQKRSSSRTDSGTVERVRKEQGQGSDTGRGSRAEEEKRRSKSSSDGRVRQDSERRRLTVGSYEVNYSDGVALNSDDQDIQSYLEARGFTANAITDITLANGTQLEGFTTGKNVYYDANGDKWQITGHELVHALKRVDRKGYEALKNRIIKGIGKKNFNKLVEAYEELYGTVYNKANTNDIVEEIICDIAGNVMSGIDSIKGFEITDDMANAVNDYLDSAVTDSLVEGDSGLVSDELKFLPKYHFRPYNETKSDTNEIATRWAYNEDLKNGARTIVYHRGVPYLIEKFDSLDLKYQIVKRIKKKELELYEQYYSRTEMDKDGKVTTTHAKSRGTVSTDGQDSSEHKLQQNDVYADNNSDRHNREAGGIQRMDVNQDGRRFANDEVIGVGERTGKDKQGELKFKLQSPVEKTKDLIALHNMRAEDLLGSFDLGGIAAPSIAVIKAEQGHTKFGDYSLLFDKYTIDPKASKYNSIYSGDAYTPVFPSVDYKVNEEVTDKISKLYYDLAKKYGYDEVRPLYSYADSSNAQDKLQSYKGEKELINHLKDDTNMMKVFLLDSKGEVFEPIMKETVTELREYDVMQYDYLIEKLGKKFFEGMQTPPGAVPMKHRREYLESHKTELQSVYEDMYRELFGFNQTEINNVVDNMNNSSFMTLMRDVLNYIRNGKVKVTSEVDTTATNDAIRKEAKRSGYDKWLNELFIGIEEKVGIRNKKDLFTPSGNRRSFEVLHWEYNLENIIEAMRSENKKGISLFGGSIFGAATKEFNSIGDIKKSKDRLKTIDESEYNNQRKGFMNRLNSLAEKLSGSPDWQRLDGARELLVESIVKRKTPDGIKTYLKKEADGFYNYTDELGNEFLQLVNDIANMPTGYFEAKPMRVVGFNEIRMAVIPDNAPDKIIEGLEDNNIPYKTYEAGNDTDRIQKVNAVDEVKFKVSSEMDSEYLELAKNPEKNEERLREMVNSAAKENGYTVEGYHGTSKGGFTVFDTYAYLAKYGLFGNGAYFTENIDIAKEYQNKGKGNNKQLYSVYLKFDNPIDMDATADVSKWIEAVNRQDFNISYKGGITNEQAFRMFEETLEDEGVIRYEAEEIVRNLFEDMGYDGITHMGGGRVNKDGTRHKVWIAFYPEQIKSADLVTYDDDGNIIPLSERFNSENQDIRFKAKTPDEWKQDYAQLKKDYNKALREQTKQLDTIKRLEMETKESKGKILKEADIKKASKELKEEFFSKIPSDELTERLTEYYKVLNDTSDIDRHMLILMGGVDMAMDIAEDIIEYATEPSPDAELDNEVLSAMRGSYRISDKALVDFGSPEDVKTIKKQLRKYGIALTQNPDAMGIDVKYENLRDRFGNTFEELTAESDMVNAMLQFAEKAKARSESNIFEKNKADMIKQAAHAIFEKNYDIGKVKTYADKVKAKHDAEVAKLKQERESLKGERSELKQENARLKKDYKTVEKETSQRATEDAVFDTQKKTLVTTGRLVEQKVDTIVSEWVRSGKNLEQASQFIDNISVRYVNGSEVIEETFGTYEEYKRWQRNHPEWKVAEVVAHSNIQQAIADFGSTISSEMADFVSKAYRYKSTKNLTEEQIAELNANKESAITTASERLTKAFNDFMVAGQEHSRGLIKANGDSEIRKAVTKAYKDAYNNFKNEVIEVSKLLNIPATAESLGTFYRKAMERYNASFVKIRNELVGLKGNQDKEKEIRQRFFDLLQSTYKRVGKIKSVSTKGSFTSRTTLNTLLESGNDEQKAIANEVLRIFAEANKQARTFDATRSIRSADVVRFTGKTFETFDELVTEVASMAGDMSMVVPQSLISRMQNAKLKTAFGKSPNTLTLDEVLDNIEVLMQFNRLLETHDKFVGSSVTDSVKDVTKVVLEDIPDKKKRTKIIDMLSSWDNLQVYSTVLAGGNKNNPLKVMIDELIAAENFGVSAYREEAYEIFNNSTDKKHIKELLGLNKFGEKTYTITAEGSVIGKTQPKTYELTKDMIVALYLANAKNTYEEVIDSDGNKVWKCSDNAQHIMDGGITIPDIKEYRKGNLLDAYGDKKQGTARLSPRDIEAITNKYLTEEDKKYADVIYDYFNKLAPEKLNAVSMELEGVPIAVVENYFPIKVDPKFLAKVNETIEPIANATPDVHNQGSHKRRNPNAKNPVLLLGALRTYTNAVENDARYVSLAMPVSNINKVLYSGIYQNAEDGKTNRQTIKNAISETLGVRFWNNMSGILEHVQGIRQAKADSSAFARNFYNAIFRFGVGSGLKQLSAVGLLPTLGNVTKLHLDNIRLIKAHKELMKYSTVYKQRTSGDISIEMKALKRGRVEKKGSVKNKLVNPMVLGDQMVMLISWAGVDNYGRANTKTKGNEFYGLEVGSEEYYRQLARTFDWYITNTQPTSTASTLSLQQLEGGFVEMAVNMFQSPNMKMKNLLKVAAVNESFAKEKLKEAKRLYQSEKTEENKLKLDDASSNAVDSRKKLFGAVLGITLNAVLFGVISVAYRELRDDDDEGFWEELLSKETTTGIAGEILISLFGQPANIAVKAYDKFSGNDFYDNDMFQIPAISVLNDAADVVSSIVNEVKKYRKAIEDEDLMAEYKVDKTALKLNAGIGVASNVVDLLKLFGIPTDNIKQLATPFVKATTNLVLDEGEAEAFLDTAFSMPFMKTKSDKYAFSTDVVEKLYNRFREEPNGFKALLDGYKNNPWSNTIDDIYGEDDNKEDRFEISQEDINKQLINYDKNAVIDSVENNIKNIMRGKTDEIDRSRDGEWTVKFEYEDGRAFMTDEINNMDDLIAEREKLLKLYNVDIYDYLIGKAYWEDAEDKYPEGISFISSVRADGSAMNDFLVQQGYKEPHQPGSDKAYKGEIFDLLQSGSWDDALEVWNYAVENNDTIKYGKDENKEEVMTKELVDYWRDDVKAKIAEQDKSADKLFYRKYTWESNGRTNTVYATTIDEINKIEDAIEADGLELGTSDVSESTYVVDEYLTRRLGKIDKGKDEKHTTKWWFMSDYLQGDYDSFVTHYYQAQQAGLKDETINDYVDDVAEELAKSYFNAGLYDKADPFLEKVTIEYLPKGADRNAKPEKKTFWSAQEAGAFVEQLQSEGYEMFNGAEFAGSEDVGKYHITNSYNKKGTVRAFRDQAKINGTIYEGDWNEVLAMPNFTQIEGLSENEIVYVDMPVIKEDGTVSKTEEKKKSDQKLTITDTSSGGGGKGGGKGGGGKGKKPANLTLTKPKIKSPGIERAKLDTKIIQPIEPFVSSARKSSAGKSVSNAKDRLSYYANGDTSSKKAESFEDVFKKWWGDA